MLVTDLRHFLDLREETRGPARRLAAQLGDIVRAATAGDVGTTWTSAVPCRRRPGHRPCQGRVIVLRPEPSAPIRWQCSCCGDEGVISGWEDSPYDLRGRGLTIAAAGEEVVLSQEVAAVLRELQLIDIDCERVVFRIRAVASQAVMPATGEELEELIGFVAAEANHEQNRRRQRRLDAAFEMLSAAARYHGGG